MQAKTEEVMLVSSKYKQMYECRLPAQAVRFHQDRASEPDTQGYTGPGIPELLKPMHTAPCLVKVRHTRTHTHKKTKGRNTIPLPRDNSASYCVNV